MILIDTHSHIYYKDYAETIDDIISEANDQGIKKIISVGVDLKTSEQCINLADKYNCVFAACGYHPHESDQAPKRYLYELEQFSTHPKVISIGEIGLDYYYNISNPKIQKRVFQEQLELASDIQLPYIIHCRDSDQDVLKIIQNFDYRSGVIHCFASNLEFAEAIINEGLNISFTGMITFVKDLEKVVDKISINKIMIETDSPYLAPKPNRGKKNQPAWLIHIAQKIADIKKISIEEVAQITTRNAYNLFTKLNIAK